MVKFFPSSMKKHKSTDLRISIILSKINTSKALPGHIIIKLLKTNDRQMICIIMCIATLFITVPN